MVETTEEARSMLQSRYRVKLNRGGRGGKNVMHNRILSGMREELGEKVREGQRFNDAQRPPTVAGKADPDVLAKALEMYNSLGGRDPEELKAEALERARESGMIVEEGERAEVIRVRTPSSEEITAKRLRIQRERYLANVASQSKDEGESE